MGLVFLLSCCGGSTPFVDPAGLDLDPPAEAALAPCERPSAIPVGVRAGGQAGLWGRDRRALATCFEKHGILAAYIRAIVGEIKAE